MQFFFINNAIIVRTALLTIIIDDDHYLRAENLPLEANSTQLVLVGAYKIDLIF